MRMITDTIMADETESPAALYRLMAWMSPSYPVGAFSYSSGIEWAVEAGDIKDAESLEITYRLLREEGFEVYSTRYVSLTVRASYALDRLAALVGVPWLARVPKAIGDAPIRVNPLYDLMIVARLRG